MPHPKDTEDRAAELAIALGSEVADLPPSMRDTTCDLARTLVDDLHPNVVQRLEGVLAVAFAFKYAEGCADRMNFLDNLGRQQRARASVEEQTRTAPCPTEHAGTEPDARCALGRTPHRRHTLLGPNGPVPCPGFAVVAGTNR